MSDNMSRDSIEREIKRIEFFLRFGSELNLINFRSKASFSSLFLKREIRPEFELKSVKNLIKTQNNPKVFQKIKNSLTADERSSHTLPAIALSFWTSDNPKEEDKQHFRCLSLELVSKMSSSEVLEFCHLLGKKRINSSKKLRKVFKEFYCRELTEEEFETIVVFSRERGIKT